MFSFVIRNMREVAFCNNGVINIIRIVAHINAYGHIFRIVAEALHNSVCRPDTDRFSVFAVSDDAVDNGRGFSLVDTDQTINTDFRVNIGGNDYGYETRRHDNGKHE